MALSKKENLILIALEAWVVAGIIAGLLFYIYMDIPSTKWGVPESPERLMLMCFYTVLSCLPIWVWSIYRYKMQKRWLAEDMGLTYEPNRIYPLFTTKRIVICALGVSLFGISGIIPATTFDLPQFIASFLTLLYGPIEGGIGVGLGFLLIRGPIFSGYANPFQLIGYCLGDGAIYFLAGHFYRQYIYYKPLKWRMTIGLVSYVLFVNFLHVGWFIPGLTWGVIWTGLGPLDYTLAQRAFANYYWCPFAWLPNIVLAYLVATALQKFKV
ncbi:MAG: hypothetical protein QXF82_00450 [Nitrososphaeria archaeon]